MSNMPFIFFCAKPVVKLLLGIIKNSLVVMVLIYSIYLYVVNLIDFIYDRHRIWDKEQENKSDRSSYWMRSVRKGVLRNFAKFTGKHLCQSPVFNEVAGLRRATLLKKRLCHRCFPVNFCKIFKNTFLTEHLRMTASKSDNYHSNNCMCKRYSHHPLYFTVMSEAFFQIFSCYHVTNT